MASIPPRARLTATLLAAIASFVANRFAPLILAMAVLMLLLARAGLLKTYLKFLLAVLGPTAFMLILIWGFIARAPPGMPMGSDPRGGAEYAGIIAFRLAALGGVIQLALLSVPSRLLPATLRGWGLRGEGLVVALGVFAVGPELILRSEQVLTARQARGLAIGGRWGKFREVPRLLRPLFVWSIRSAVQRSEAWQQRALLLKVEQLPFASDEFWPAGGVIIVSLSLMFLILSVGWRWL
jgi:energy-coupling factor transporter transmembrane protein EcfT